MEISAGSELKCCILGDSHLAGSCVDVGPVHNLEAGLLAHVRDPLVAQRAVGLPDGADVADSGLGATGGTPLVTAGKIKCEVRKKYI